jgi:hypothetical protein
MAEVDYGYGDQEDFGYGDAAPDTDYGYGDTTQDMDYGYGDTPAPEQPDYGYGDAAPEDDYGYGDSAPEPVPQKDRRPKRRCSVTKFSLATETPLTAASVIADLRNGLAPEPTLEANDDCKSYMTDDTGSMDLDYSPSMGMEPAKEQPIAVRKKGVMSRLRKRLSIAM